MSGPARRSGVSLLEVLFSIVVIVLSIIGLIASMLQGMALDQASRESELAMHAAREVIETMRSTERFNEIYSRYNSDPSDDPLASEGEGVIVEEESSNSRVSISASAFSVKGLAPRSDAGDRFVGRIEFPDNSLAAAGGGSSPAGLREDVEDEDFGMPRDLDGSNSVDNQDHSSDYMILPVRIVLEWTGARGPARFEFVTLLTPEE